MPATVPPDVTDAIAGALLAQVPPGRLAERLMKAPTQRLDGPERLPGAGVRFIVTTFVAKSVPHTLVIV